MTHTSPSFSDGKRSYKLGSIDKDEEDFWSLCRWTRSALRQGSGNSKRDRFLQTKLGRHFPTLVEEGWVMKDSFHLDSSLQLLFVKAKTE